MKLPAVRLDKDSVLDFFLHNVEKMVVAVIAAIATWLLWGGLTAIRTKTASRSERPAAVVALATEMAAHIEKQQKLPESMSLERTGLTASIDPWRAPHVDAARDLPPLDKPLFQELSRRAQPDIFAIKDLRAVAGVAVVVGGSAAAGGGGSGRDVDHVEGRRGKADRAAGAAPPASRIQPYCIVTGLIPFAEQVDEYRRRYESTSHRDPKRDAPLWSDYTVERCVGPVGKDDAWQPVDLATAAKRAREEWAGSQPENLPPEFLLAADRALVAGPLGYCGPLPRLETGAWGQESLHPWFVEQMRQMAAARKTTEQQKSTVPAGGAKPVACDYRLFRFIDADVEPGKTYRYRVRLEVWNPNFNLPPQHVETAALAREKKLKSTESNVTPAVTVPGLTTLLVRSLRKADTKRMKPGLVEILVLGENRQTGNFSLRSLITEVGGLVNVDDKLNRPAETRTRGEDISTDCVVVDMLGQQDEPDETSRTGRPSPPPEPLEVLFLRPDGGFDLATTVDSEEMYQRFAATLPAADEAKPTTR
ncbi:MAG: hypothetical protein EBZ59_07860, partial [Planctomycetia bacterium]|nr:hypothetical protein [Planctomycetia bacterium]